MDRDVVRRRLDGYRAKLASRVIGNWREAILRRAWAAWHAQWAQLRQAERVERLAANATSRLHDLQAASASDASDAQAREAALRRRMRELEAVNKRAIEGAVEANKAARRQAREAEWLREQCAAANARLGQKNQADTAAAGTALRRAEALWGSAAPSRW
eukprot:7071975-Prymnesium_polylepis.1